MELEKFEFIFNAASFLTDEAIMFMPAAYIGFLFKLICHSTINTGIPEDIGDIADICKLDKENMQKVWKTIGSFFVKEENSSRLLYTGKYIR